ncbi:MAG: SseB family protein [Methanobrevibacter sp.]|uniref:SseB family protein n=1 Tax=Methanobrevibacter sp. TaxID=66852 RepID=UPI0026DF2276|nr:SseB family protein [Methanobrevibacter sp.]MDO5849062.1 SseB family protein [Methanobrevibacter sp.]
MTNSRLEDLMAIDPGEMSEDVQKEFFNELKASRLFLPVNFISNPINPEELEEWETLELSEPLRFEPVLLKINEKFVLPLFTNEEALEQMGRVNVINYAATDIAELLLNLENVSEVLINPNTDSSIGMARESFVMQCLADEISGMIDIASDLNEFAVPLEQNTKFYLRSETPFMADEAEEDVFTASEPFFVSSLDVFHPEYEYLNVLVVPKGMMFLYLGNIVDNLEENHDVVLAPVIRFHLEESENDTFIWKAIEQELGG